MQVVCFFFQWEFSDLLVQILWTEHFFSEFWTRIENDETFFVNKENLKRLNSRKKNILGKGKNVTF